MWKPLATAFFVVALLAGAWLQSRDLLEPWEDGHRGSCAALFSLMAKNHLRYGLFVTGGVGVVNQERCDPEHFQYYTHHPQGVPLLATVGAMIGGTRSGLRLTFFPFAVGIVLLLYRLGKRRGGVSRAFAAALAATCPLGVYYGAFVNFEIPTLFFLLLALLLYERHRRRGRRKDLVRAALATFAAVLCDWIALGLPLFLLVLEPFRRNHRRARTLWAPVAAAALSVVVSKAQVYLQIHRYGRPLDASWRYLLSVTPLNPDFRWGVWYDALKGHALELLGPALLGLAVLGLLPTCRRLLRLRLDSFDVAALVLLLTGVANVTVLAHHAIGHDYYLLYLMPAVALFGGQALGLPFARPSPLLLRGFVFALAAGVGLHQVSAAKVVLDQRRSFGLTQLGENVKQATRPGEVVFLAEDYFTLQVALAADRHVDFAPDPQKLEFAKRRARVFGLAGRPAVLLVPKSKDPPLDAAYSGWLEKTFPKRETPDFLIYELGKI